MSINTDSANVGLLGGNRMRAALLALLFAIVAIALQFTSFGDTNRSADELFYLLVGQRMHEGLLPYVDVWDRKPLGIFLIYYVIARFSESVVLYQVIACLFTAGSAVVIGLIVKTWAGWRGALLSGLSFLAVTVIFQGSSGQTPDFYNILIATAALFIVREMDSLAQGVLRWRIWVAMALCGLAITIKQTSLFESIYFGLYVLVVLYRAGAKPGWIARVALGCALIGAIPTLSIAAFYWHAGHWHEFWYAMVTSNIAKGGVGGKGFRAVGLILRMAPLLVLALWVLFSLRTDERARFFLSGWLLMALVGFLSVPNFFTHYTLPLLVPLAVAAGMTLGTHRRGGLLGGALAVYTFVWYTPPSQEWSRSSAKAMNEAARLIRRHDPGGGLFVFDAPSYLYSLSGKPFLSPLVFPHHVSNNIEKNVSHLKTNPEVDRILERAPGVVVISSRPYILPVNQYTRSKVLNYANRFCSKKYAIILLDAGQRAPFDIYGDCMGS